MFHILRSRFVGVLLAAIYIAMPGGAFGVRACAHHDGLAHAPADAAAATDVHAGHGGGHDAPADPASGGVIDTGTDGHAGDDAPHGGCSCLDACAAGSAIVLHADASVEAEYSPVERSAATFATAAAPRAPPVPYSHPYPNGPPAGLPV